MYYYKKGNSYLKLKEELNPIPEDYVAITEEEFVQYVQIAKSRVVDGKQKRIAQLKRELAKTDYQCFKWSEGWLTDEEYAPIKAHRQELRDEINALENSTVIEGGN